MGKDGWLDSEKRFVNPLHVAYVEKLRESWRVRLVGSTADTPVEYTIPSNVVNDRRIREQAWFKTGKYLVNLANVSYVQRTEDGYEAIFIGGLPDKPLILPIPRSDRYPLMSATVLEPPPNGLNLDGS